MLEIEIKAYCSGHDEIIRRIEKLGGTLQKRVSEKDVYYRHPARDFASTDEAFRIRIEDGKNILTYKGPKIGTKSKTRIEKEVLFSDLTAMKEILGMLGFSVVDEISKKRSIYKIKDIEVCIDDVDVLGKFVELEKLGENREEGEKEIFALAGDLGLTDFETRSYLELKLAKNP